jgi:hypothetical protein
MRDDWLASVLHLRQRPAGASTMDADRTLSPLNPDRDHDRHRRGEGGPLGADPQPLYGDEPRVVGGGFRPHAAGGTVAGKVRILLVICRPKAGEDVPFRSVAGRLVTRLSEGDREAFDLDVLRPPTYDQLAMTLRLAKERGEPYHIVHFDGHGGYADPHNLAAAGEMLSTQMLRAEATGARGYLVFENPGTESRSEHIAIPLLGRRLTRVCGATYEQMRSALLSDEDPEIREWARTKGAANSERELKRIYERALPGCADGGVTLEDFRAYMPMHSYIFTPNGEMWPASSVNARLPPMPLSKNDQPVLDDAGKQKMQPATAWLVKNRSVESMAWAPGEPMLVPGRLISGGGR